MKVSEFDNSIKFTPTSSIAVMFEDEIIISSQNKKEEIKVRVRTLEDVKDQKGNIVIQKVQFLQE